MRAAAVPRDAATVVLVRDGPAGGGPLEVLLLERPASATFAPRATVFPGGGVDPADRHPAWAAASTAGVGRDLRAPLACAVAAVRECFEETGILLARDGDGRPIPEGLAAALAITRKRLLEGDAGALRRQLADHGLRPDLGQLAFIAHWITPAGLPRRYDTRFYLTRAPDRQAAVADPRGEHVRCTWSAPGAALAHGIEGSWQLLPPTRAVLAWVAGHASVAAALTAARAREVTTVVPDLGDLTRERVPGLDPAVLRPGHGG